LKIESVCQICQHRWSAAAASLLRGIGCPKCGLEKARLTPKYPRAAERFQGKLAQIYAGVITVLSAYNGTFAPIQAKCSTCSTLWKTTPSRLQRHGCPSCGHSSTGAKLRKTTEQFLVEIEAIHGDKLCLLDEYQTGKTRVSVRCSRCGHSWRPVAHRLVGETYRGCPRCCMSKGEKHIARVLLGAGVCFTQEHTFLDLYSPNKGKLRFDFAVWGQGSLSHLIEYDGKYHHRPYPHAGGELRLERQKRNDRLKTEYCLANEIRLVRLSSIDYKSITLEHLL
jgi:predicted  nucleic acid-binding Zn-ribbon protein